MIELINLIYESRFSLILSDTSSEHIKEHLISQFSPIDITNYNNKSLLRDFKINEATNIKQYYVFDIMAITPITDTTLTRAKVLQSTLRHLREYSTDNNRFIISGSAYRGLDSNNGMTSIGGVSPMYVSECIIAFYKRSEKYYYTIMKNRYGNNVIESPLPQFNRESQINKIIY